MSNQILSNCNEATRRRNPHLFGASEAVTIAKDIGTVPPKTRLRQSSKPLMNKTEGRFAAHLAALDPHEKWHAQAVTLLLASGVRYTPDFLSFKLRLAYEVKGKWASDDSIVKLKVAARVYPELQFVLVWEQDGRWQEQIILP